MPPGAGGATLAAQGAGVATGTATTPATRQAAEDAATGRTATQAARVAVEAAHSEHWGRLLALLTRLVGNNLDVAEESLQDAYESALTAWARDGVPAKPDAWLLTAARRRATDRFRRRGTLRPQAAAAGLPEEPEVATDMSTIPDERLRLLFTCCHPALPLEARVALTLRLLGGLTTRRDRPGVPGRRGDDGAPGYRAKRKIRPPASRTGCRATRAARAAGRRARPCSTWSSPRATRPARATSRSGRALRRGDPAGPGAGRADAATSPRRPGCWRCCCCSTPAAKTRTDPAGGWCCWRSRTGTGGTAAAIDEGAALLASRRAPRGPPGRTCCRRRSRPCTRPRRDRGRHRLGRGSPRSTRRWTDLAARRWSRSTGPSRSAMVDGPAAGLRRWIGRWTAAGRLPPACRRPGPTCCAGSAGPPRRPPRTGRRSPGPGNAADREFLARRLAELTG